MARRPAATASSMRPGKPAHFAEIGVIQRNVRLDGNGAAQVFDRVGGLARLVRDDAEHVFRFGIVRIGGGRAPRQFLGIGQKPMAALLFGENERLTRGDGLRRRRWRVRGLRRLPPR